MTAPQEMRKWCAECRSDHHYWGPAQMRLWKYWRSGALADEQRDREMVRLWEAGVCMPSPGKKYRTVARGIRVGLSGRFEVFVSQTRNGKTVSRYTGRYATPQEAIAARDGGG